jgi:hypothetical protein
VLMRGAFSSETDRSFQGLELDDGGRAFFLLNAARGNSRRRGYEPNAVARVERGISEAGKEAE